MGKSSVAFIGLTHLGLVTSICWATIEEVTAIGLNEKCIKKLRNNKIPVYEPNLQELLNRVKKSYFPISDFSLLGKIQLIFFALDTPLDGSFPKELDQAIDKAIPFFQQNVILVIISQIPVGYCRNIHKRIVKKRPELKFSLYYWVNTIVIGNSIECFLKPERIIIGSLDKNQDINPQLIRRINKFKCPVIKISYESAELTKSAVNLFLAASISAANNLADFCEVSDADINEIIPALKLDKRIGPFAYLIPTIRIAGGHLERELLHFVKLGNRKGLNKNLAKYILELNEIRYLWTIKKINGLLKTKPTVCIWGLSYKKGSTSTENAASLKIIQALKNKATLNVYDPMAIMPNTKNYKRLGDMYTALKGADCLLILTDWDEFKKTDFKKIKKLMKNPLIIDTTALLYNDRILLKNLGIKYITLGLGENL